MGGHHRGHSSRGRWTYGHHLGKGDQPKDYVSLALCVSVDQNILFWRRGHVGCEKINSKRYQNAELIERFASWFLPHLLMLFLFAKIVQVSVEVPMDSDHIDVNKKGGGGSTILHVFARGSLLPKSFPLSYCSLKDRDDESSHCLITKQYCL